MKILPIANGMAGSEVENRINNALQSVSFPDLEPGVVIDDDTMGSATDANIPTAKSIKDYTDALVAGASGDVTISVVNSDTTTMLKGDSVRVTTAGGGVTGVVKSQAISGIDSFSIGTVKQDLAVGQQGEVLFVGELENFDTSAWAEGDILFVDTAVAGTLTNIQQEILSPVAIVLTSDPIVGKILVKPRGVINLNSIGQALGGVKTITITTTPTKLSSYGNALPLALNTILTQVDTGGGNFTAEITPDGIAASGYYELSFSAVIDSAANNIFFFEVYKNDLASGFVGVVNLSNNNIDSGTTSFTAILPNTLVPGDKIEIWTYADAGTNTVNFANTNFNIKRIGNV